MRIGDDIYNLDGQPFRNEGLAVRMRDLLLGETGNDYVLVTYPEGGFVIRLTETGGRHQSHDRGPTRWATQSPNGVDHPDQQGKPGIPKRTLKDYELRQAVFRTNIFSLPLMAGAIGLVLFSDSFLLSALAIINIQPSRLGEWLQRIDQAMTGTGALVLALIWLSFLWQRAGALYRVTGFGVEARLGIIAHQTVGLRFQDIRSMGIKQTLFDRLLNVGLLEFTSAGTDGDPVRFVNIASPGNVLQTVKERMAGMGSPD